MTTQTLVNDESEYGPVFNNEEQKKITSLENLLKARKNLLHDIDRYADDADDDTDGLKEYRGIF